MGKFDRLDDCVETIRKAGRMPGVAVALVHGKELVFAKGYGHRDMEAQLPMTAQTVYPIASTTKAINATLLGMLVDDGKIAWDDPVQKYLPRFGLQVPTINPEVTLRDLVLMRTGLPRHEWMWTDNCITRAELVERIRHLDLSCGLRERFQYNNLTVTIAGHVAEVATGREWDDLVRERILAPLGMRNTGFSLPSSGDVSASYYEDVDRRLLRTIRMHTDLTAPAGGTMHSTVEDMARWLSFNLCRGQADGRALINSRILAEIHSPQMVVGGDPSVPSPDAVYAMGWFVDSYQHSPRLSHGGYLHHVDSYVMLFPRKNIGIVSFTNFGPPMFSKLICEHVYDALEEQTPAQTLDEKLISYEKLLDAAHKRSAAVRRVQNTSPSHPLEDYVGMYEHPAYGQIETLVHEGTLAVRRSSLLLPLEHWHYDVWLVASNRLFAFHRRNGFDRSSRLLFETHADGHIAALHVPLELAVSPVRFVKQFSGAPAE